LEDACGFERGMAEAAEAAARHTAPDAIHCPSNGNDERDASGAGLVSAPDAYAMHSSLRPAPGDGSHRHVGDDQCVARRHRGRDISRPYIRDGDVPPIIADAHAVLDAIHCPSNANDERIVSQCIRRFNHRRRQ
jgi:hypothetical protein